jgi:hypothetical protein
MRLYAGSRAAFGTSFTTHAGTHGSDGRIDVTFFARNGQVDNNVYINVNVYFCYCQQTSSITEKQVSNMMLFMLLFHKSYFRYVEIGFDRALTFAEEMGFYVEKLTREGATQAVSSCLLVSL